MGTDGDDERTHEHIAEIMGMGRAAVDRRPHRAYRRLEAPALAGSVSRDGREPIAFSISLTEVRIRALCSLAVALLVAAGCAGEGPTASSSPATDAPPPASTSAPATASTTASTSAPTSSAAPVAGTWEESTAVLSTSGVETQSDAPPELPEVQVIGWTSAGHLVVGSVNGGFTVWRSTDLTSFEPVYSDVCCDRFLRATSIGEFDGSILIGGSGEFGPERSEQAFLLRSEDGGMSWTLIDDPLFTSEANRVDRIVATDGAVIVAAVDDRAPGVQPQSKAAWSEDLTSWQPVDLPGREADDWPWFVHGDDVVFAISQRSDDLEGSFTGWAAWRSDDGGRTFVQAPTLTDPNVGYGGFLVAQGDLVAAPSVYQSTSHHEDAHGPAALQDGVWTGHPADTGVWGDGLVSMYPAATSTTSTTSTGRAYALITRTTRASVHYCYDDTDSCRLTESALVVADDVATWSQVDGFPAPALPVDVMSLTADQDTGVVLVSPTHQDPATDRERVIQITRWTGAGAPPEIDGSGYPGPNIPVPLYDDEQPLDVGDERRFPLALGTCGGMYVDGQRWEPDTPLPDPVPASWPYRSAEGADGPEGFVYGRVRRLSADAIEFSIEGVGPVATFRPAPPREATCY